jgi:hypothetical protein
MQRYVRGESGDVNDGIWPPLFFPRNMCLPSASIIIREGSSTFSPKGTTHERTEGRSHKITTTTTRPAVSVITEVYLHREDCQAFPTQHCAGSATVVPSPNTRKS